MSQAADATTPTPRRGRRALLRGVIALVIVVPALWILGQAGRRFYADFQDYRDIQREAEDTAPIGYVGVSLRRSYHDRPAQFLSEKEGRKLLWAAKGEDGQPESYDVTEADFAVEALSGGFGRDSNPGIDYPLFEGPDSERGRRLRARQVFYGLVLGVGPRAYPADLLRKIEVVNDRDGGTPFAAVFDRRVDEGRFYERTIDGKEVTFGTTGYALADSPDPTRGAPLLYDRRTRSLWLPGETALVCVNGPLKGTKLPIFKAAKRTTWSAWRSRYPRTLVLMGSDRSKPIPGE